MWFNSAMRKSVPLFIGTRYILAKKDNRFISFTSLISMAGLTLGVLALIIVLSVFNGSQGIMRERTLITVPHANIYTAGAFPTWLEAVEALQSRPGIEGVSPYISGEAMLSKRGFHQVTQIKGILPAAESRVSPIEASMLAGSLHDLSAGRHGIVLGRGAADALRVDLGDSVNLIVPDVRAGRVDFDLNMHTFTVAGIFDVQFNIGANLALVHLDDGLDLLGLPAVEDAVRLRLAVTEVDRADETVAAAVAWLNATLPGPDYRGEDWSVTEASLFNALKMEKIMTSFMLMMIVAIGAFNIISTLVMVVSEKQADIAILRTMGAGARTIMGVFVAQGVVVGVLGILLGASMGVLIATHFSILASVIERVVSPAGLYVIGSLPAQLEIPDVVVVCAGALLISFLATLYPAYKASRIHPAEVLRYE